MDGFYRGHRTTKNENVQLVECGVIIIKRFMELVLDVYKSPFDPRFPVVCMDESPKQLIAEMRVPITLSPGRPAMHDYEYKRCGVCNIFLACEPLAGKRIVAVCESRTKQDWACFLREIAGHWDQAEKITLVMNNLNTHTPGALSSRIKRKRYGTSLNLCILRSMGAG